MTLGPVATGFQHLDQKVVDSNCTTSRSGVLLTQKLRPLWWEYVPSFKSWSRNIILHIQALPSARASRLHIYAFAVHILLHFLQNRSKQRLQNVCNCEKT